MKIKNPKENHVNQYMQMLLLTSAAQKTLCDCVEKVYKLQQKDLMRVRTQSYNDAQPAKVCSLSFKRLTFIKISFDNFSLTVHFGIVINVSIDAFFNSYHK